ncbi:MAG: carboxyl transferase [Lachnospiraceae bacterium]|nr:carboxyl transferase [Lachnospiraceae bacterium]
MMNTKEIAAISRISSFVDEGSFVEVGKNLSDSVVTGYALVDGRLVYIYSQNPDACGGAIGENHSKKITNIYDMALKMGAPVIGIFDCAGVSLNEANAALMGLGSLYQAASKASGIIPQLTMVMGGCGGGVSILPALSDFTFVEEKKGSLFLQSPNAIPANTREKCDTSNAQWKAEHTQNVDFIGTDDDLYETVRRFVQILPGNNRYAIEQDICNDDLNRMCETIEDAVSDAPTLLSMLADGYDFIETKKHIAKDLTTGFLKLNGMTIGVVANNDDTLTAQGVAKAAAFVKYCDAFSIPVLTVANVSGFESSFEAEITFPSACAAFVSAYASATIPKVTLITDQAMGSAGMIMGGKTLGTALVLAWNDAKIGAMEGTFAAKILYAEEGAATIRLKAAEYDEKNTADAAAGCGAVDMIIDAKSTRKYLISAFDMLATKQEVPAYRKSTSIF